MESLPHPVHTRLNASINIGGDCMSSPSILYFSSEQSKVITMTYFHVWQPTGGFMRLAACTPPVQPKHIMKHTTDWKPSNMEALALLAALSTVPLPHSAAAGSQVSASIQAPKVTKYNFFIVTFSHRNRFFDLAAASANEEQRSLV